MYIFIIIIIIIIIIHSYITLIEFCILLGMLTFCSALQGIEVLLCEKNILFMLENAILEEMQV